MDRFNILNKARAAGNRLGGGGNPPFPVII